MNAKKIQKITILLVSSGGGHRVQLFQLLPLIRNEKLVYLTSGNKIPSNKINNFEKIIYVNDANKKHPLLVIVQIINVLITIIKIKPDYIISTGASVGAISIILGKILGAKNLWIDSLANPKKISLSGQIAISFCDEFLVQWPHLEFNYKKAKYIGKLI